MSHAAGWGDEPLRPTRGMRLGGRYELRRRIAVGGMGEVWLSRDLSLDRSVATKLLREELAGDDRFLARLRAEARASAPLTHPNIAALYDYGEQAGSGYLIMELVPGETLSELLVRERTLAPEALLPILAQTARALHAAHVSGVVHRDVKPSNILLTPDGRVKITDFGISQVKDGAEAATAGTVMGTAQYLAPEQALGRAATPSSDIYGLGVVAYEALAGRRPFTGPSVVDIAYAHVNKPVPPLPDSVPEPVRTVVLRMLEKDPERRPRSAASLARSLDRITAELELARPFDQDSPGITSGAHADDDGARLDQAVALWGLLPDVASLDTEPFDVEAFSDERERSVRPLASRPVPPGPLDDGWVMPEPAPAGARRPAPSPTAESPASESPAAEGLAAESRAVQADVDLGVGIADQAAEEPLGFEEEDVEPRWHPVTALPLGASAPVGTAPRPRSRGHAAPPRSRRRSAHRLARRSMPWLWLGVVVAVTIATVLLLAAARLAWSVDSAPVGGSLVGRVTTAGAASPDHGERAVGSDLPHPIQSEVGSW